MGATGVQQEAAQERWLEHLLRVPAGNGCIVASQLRIAAEMQAQAFI
jgi:hypothetical protein